MPIFGGDGGDDSAEIGADVLDTPVARRVIERARRDDRVVLEERDAPLVAVLEAVQEFVDDHEYTDGVAPEYEHLFEGFGGEVESLGAGRAGNAFVDWVWMESRERSLVEARKVTDSELFVVATEEVWSYVAGELDLTTTEARAARDVHALYAVEQGLAGSIGHSLMALTVPHDRLGRFASLEYVDDREYRGAGYDEQGAGPG